MIKNIPAKNYIWKTHIQTESPIICNFIGGLIEGGVWKNKFLK